jgi:hypothetical protein
MRSRTRRFTSGVVPGLGLLLAGGAAWAQAPADLVGAFRTRAVEAYYEQHWVPGIEAALAACDTLPVPAQPGLPEDVTDGVFGYMIGLFDDNLYGVVSNAHIVQVLEALHRPSRVPTAVIESVTRARGDASQESWVEVRFTGPMKVPVPYDILGYHPGSLAGTQTVIVREWRVGHLQIPFAGPPEPVMLTLEDLALWGVVSGEIEIDIDGWLDALLGSRLDDTRVVGLAVFRFQGARYAMALGYSPAGEPRSGSLDLQRDEIRFPSSEELKAIARNLRSRIVERLARMGLPIQLPR